ncbi:MAG: DEAD/DEAH box helicase [Polyangiales bacterium]
MTTTTETPEEQELTFSAMNLSAPILKAIEEIGWDTPTPCQFQSFKPSSDGRDLIVQSRTGTGKTAAFGLPLVDSRVSEEPKVQALILAPTRELALQSAREISRLGQYRNIATTAVYGGAPIEKQVRALADGAQIVSGTPGRVLDHLKRGTLNAEGLKVLVLDEADEMLSMGFAKELHAIMDLLPKERQTLLYSATVDGPVQRMGERHMTDPVHLQLSGDAVGALGVTHYVYMVTGAGRARDLVKIIENEDPESGIIFCNTKAETEQVAAYLQKAGYSAAWLNGDLAQNDRERVMKSTRDGELRFLVATDVAARGIDISHVTHVINFALPVNIEQYVHRTGRTGRAGRTGTAMSLVAPQELGTLYYLRLQYSIFPIERSLPSVGEEKTRQETDRVEMLKAALGTHPASDTDLAVAKRLLTHADAERILAGFVGSFFGTKADPDAEAAAARRERKPRPAKREARGEKREKREPREKREARGKREPREKREERSEKLPDSSAEKQVDGSGEKREARKERPRRTREERAARREERSARREARAPRESQEDAQTASVNAEKAPEAKAPEAKVESAPESKAPEAKVEPKAVEAVPAVAPETEKTEKPSEEPRRRREEEEGFTRLYVNLGRKDNMRVGDLNEMFQEDAGLTRDEVGRIRLRDKHSFVSVPEDKVEAVLAALIDIEVDGRLIKVEVAKGN